MDKLASNMSDCLKDFEQILAGYLCYSDSLSYVQIVNRLFQWHAKDPFEKLHHQNAKLSRWKLGDTAFYSILVWGGIRGLLSRTCDPGAQASSLFVPTPFTFL